MVWAKMNTEVAQILIGTLAELLETGNLGNVCG